MTKTEKQDAIYTFFYLLVGILVALKGYKMPSDETIWVRIVCALGAVFIFVVIVGICYRIIGKLREY